MTPRVATSAALSDSELMVNYCHGDSDAFECLYARHRQSLYQFVLHGCSNSASASEIFQDVWMAVVKARSGYQDSGNFKAWLFRIARNKLVDFYRRGSGRDEVEFDETVVDPQITTINAPLNPMELAELEDDRSRVLDAVGQLPWRQREAVLLKYVGGFSLAEIAVEQGDPAETVKSRLRYAYTKLRQQLRATP